MHPQRALLRLPGLSRAAKDCPPSGKDTDPRPDPPAGRTPIRGLIDPTCLLGMLIAPNMGSLMFQAKPKIFFGLLATATPLLPVHSQVDTVNSANPSAPRKFQGRACRHEYVLGYLQRSSRVSGCRLVQADKLPFGAMDEANLLPGADKGGGVQLIAKCDPRPCKLFFGSGCWAAPLGLLRHTQRWGLLGT